ncbi:MAG: hypothetical protein IJ134_00475 [Bacilli bacterium]|nr:hypothetical protein [Bacilli bacterium]
MDLLIIVIFILIIVCWFRKFSSFIYALAIIDIFLRIISFVAHNIGVKEISSFLIKYVPKSIPSVIDAYSSGILNSILLWGFVICYGIFEFYIIKTFIHKR